MTLLYTIKFKNKIFYLKMKAKFQRLEALSLKIRAIRLNGSCALNMCMIAKGVFEGFYEIGIKLNL